MSSQYSCELCKKVFKQKGDLTKHKKRKSPCISKEEIVKLSKAEDVKLDTKSKMVHNLKSYLDILRDNEGITGQKALINISYLMVLKLIEPQLDKEIDIDSYDFDFSHIEDDNVESHRKRLLKIARFSNLAKENDDNLSHIIKYLWDDILSKHPCTETIFLKDKGFDIQHTNTFKKLIQKLSSIDLVDTENDILGSAYEEVMQQTMTGKVLGQHFTPLSVKTMMVKLIDPQIHPDGKIDTCGDPTMGTGGFLITYLRYILHQANAKNIKPDWEYIINEGLYGKEKEPDTYQLAISNMLISSGHLFDKIEKGDSVREPITRKFDNILANPPFGIDGLEYSGFNNPLKNEYLPIKSNSAVPLFIQAIIYMLKIGGKCAVVLPDGQELFSKSTKALIAVREYLMKTCDLKEVIYLPAGIFEHAPIKTCVLYFVKKREGTDVLKTEIKTTKTTQKETSRKYEFSKTHQTTKIKFYDYNPYVDVKNLLVEVSIEKLASNSYSLNYSEYIRHETKEEKYGEGIIIKTLGEVCNFDIGGTPSRSNPKYYENGNNLWLSVKELNGGYIYDTKEKITELGVQNSNVKLFEKETILFSFKLSIGKTGIVGSPLYTNEAIAGITIKNPDLLYHKYLYHYLTMNDFSKLGTGIIGNGSLNKKSLGQLKIPIPSLEQQQEIVKYLDFIYEKANKTSNEKIIELKQLNEFCLNNQKVFGDNEIKTLGEVCNFKNGKGIKKDALNEGEYPVIGGGQKPLGFHNEYNTQENTILCSSSGAYAGFISKYDKKTWASDCFSIIPKNEDVNNTYLYYLLKSQQDKIYKNQSGAAQPHVYSKDLQELKIPIPSLERQKEIVDYCEYNDKLIKELEKEIENNKIQAQQFMTSILNASVQLEEKENISSDSE